MRKWIPKIINSPKFPRCKWKFYAFFLWSDATGRRRFWGVGKGSSISWVVKFKGDKSSEWKLSNGWSRSYREIKPLLLVAMLQGDTSASQSSMELYYPWISGPLRVSRQVLAIHSTTPNPPNNKKKPDQRIHSYHTPPAELMTSRKAISSNNSQNTPFWICNERSSPDLQWQHIWIKDMRQDLKGGQKMFVSEGLNLTNFLCGCKDKNKRRFTNKCLHYLGVFLVTRPKYPPIARQV